MYIWTYAVHCESSIRSYLNSRMGALNFKYSWYATFFHHFIVQTSFCENIYIYIMFKKIAYNRNKTYSLSSTIAWFCSLFWVVSYCHILSNFILHVNWLCLCHTADSNSHTSWDQIWWIYPASTRSSMDDCGSGTLFKPRHKDPQPHLFRTLSVCVYACVSINCSFSVLCVDIVSIFY